MSTFYWLRAWEDIAWGDGTRTVQWETLYQGFDYSALLNAAQPAISFNEWVIVDSQDVGSSTWNARTTLNRPYEVGGVATGAPPDAPAWAPYYSIVWAWASSASDPHWFTIWQGWVMSPKDVDAWAAADTYANSYLFWYTWDSTAQKWLPSGVHKVQDVR